MREVGKGSLQTESKVGKKMRGRDSQSSAPVISVRCWQP